MNPFKWAKQQLAKAFAPKPHFVPEASTPIRALMPIRPAPAASPVARIEMRLKAIGVALRTKWLAESKREPMEAKPVTRKYWFVSTKRVEWIDKAGVRQSGYQKLTCRTGRNAEKRMAGRQKIKLAPGFALSVGSARRAMLSARRERQLHTTLAA